MRQFLTVLLFLTSSWIVYSQDFEPGYFIDYSNVEHQGLIRIKKKDGGFRFKESENAKSVRISTREAKYFKMGEREFYVKSFDTFAEAWENSSDYLHGDSYVEKSRYFVELVEEGLINVYAHSDLEFNGIAPKRDMEFYIEKGRMVSKMTSDYSVLPLKLFGTLKKYMGDDDIYLEMYKKKVYRDGDWLTFVKDYNNKYRNDISKNDTLIVYRSNKKQKQEPINITSENRTWTLAPNTLVKIAMSDITDFELCVGSDNCKNFGGSLIRENYFEASLSTDDERPTITYADKETGEFHITRIEYLMKKAKKKSSK